MIVVAIVVALLEFEFARGVGVFEVDALVLLRAAEAEEFRGEGAFPSAVEVFALAGGEGLHEEELDAGAALFADDDADDEAEDEDDEEEGGDAARVFDEEAVPVAVAFVGVDGAAGVLEVGGDAGFVGAEAYSEGGVGF